MLKELLPYRQHDGYHFRYWITYTEEAILNPNFAGYVGGRLEIYIDEEQYDIDEFRFLTKKKSFPIFRWLTECKQVNIIGLYIIRFIIKHYYYEKQRLTKTNKRLTIPSHYTR